jgi:hypothetical protein
MTDGSWLSADAGALAVEVALRHGWRAARRGRALPLPVLLDLSAAFSMPRYPRPLFRPDSGQTAEIAAYKAWLQRFCSDVPRHLGVRPTLRNARPPSLLPNYLETLLQDWPATPAEDARSLEWKKAYATLLAASGARAQIRAHWAGPRDTDLAHWKRWFPNQPRSQDGRPCASAMWDLFARLPDQDELHERFDHDAARIYVDAVSPDFLDDQQARIELLRRRDQLKLDPPEGYDSLNPYSGETTLSTLCQGSYGDYKRVNRSDIRISDAVPTLPLSPIEIHLCWANGYTGLSLEHPCSPGHRSAGRSDTQARLNPRQEAHSLVTGASTLQGVVALLLDDWRFMLRDLPLEFYAHRGPPDLRGDRLGPGGERWNTRKQGQDGRPPWIVVSRLFERRTWDNAGVQDLRWSPPASAFGWWCAVLLLQDLAEFGFREQPELPAVDLPQQGWLAEGNALPSCISHLIAVMPPDQGGRIFQVFSSRDRQGHDQAELRPLPERQSLAQGADSSFRTLRIMALDVVLDVLRAAI